MGVSEVTIDEDGVNAVSYNLTVWLIAAGNYSLSAMYAGLPIGGSPFSLVVVAGSIFGASLPAFGPLQAGVPVSVSVQGLDGYGNPSITFDAGDSMELGFAAGDYDVEYVYDEDTGSYSLKLPDAPYGGRFTLTADAASLTMIASAVVVNVSSAVLLDPDTGEYMWGGAKFVVLISSPSASLTDTFAYNVVDGLDAFQAVTVLPGPFSAAHTANFVSLPTDPIVAGQPFIILFSPVDVFNNTITSGLALCSFVAGGVAATLARDYGGDYYLEATFTLTTAGTAPLVLFFNTTSNLTLPSLVVRPAEPDMTRTAVSDMMSAATGFSINVAHIVSFTLYDRFGNFITGEPQTDFSFVSVYQYPVDPSLDFVDVKVSFVAATALSPAYTLTFKPTNASTLVFYVTFMTNGTDIYVDLTDSTTSLPYISSAIASTPSAAKSEVFGRGFEMDYVATGTTSKFFIRLKDANGNLVKSAPTTAPVVTYAPFSGFAGAGQPVFSTALSLYVVEYTFSDADVTSANTQALTINVTLEGTSISHKDVTLDTAGALDPAASLVLQASGLPFGDSAVFLAGETSQFVVLMVDASGMSVSSVDTSALVVTISPAPSVPPYVTNQGSGQLLVSFVANVASDSYFTSVTYNGTVVGQYDLYPAKVVAGPAVTKSGLFSYYDDATSKSGVLPRPAFLAAGKVGAITIRSRDAMRNNRPYLTFDDVDSYTAVLLDAHGDVATRAAKEDKYDGSYLFRIPGLTTAGPYVIRVSLPSDGPSLVAFWPLIVQPAEIDIALTLFYLSTCAAGSPCSIYVAPVDQYKNALTSGAGVFKVEVTGTITQKFAGGKTKEATVTLLATAQVIPGFPGLLRATVLPLLATPVPATGATAQLYRVTCTRKAKGSDPADSIYASDGVADLKVGPGPVSPLGTTVLGGGIASAVSSKPASFFVRLQDSNGNDVAAVLGALPYIYFTGTGITVKDVTYTIANETALGQPAVNVTYTPVGTGELSVYILAEGVYGQLVGERGGEGMGGGDVLHPAACRVGCSGVED